MPIEKWSETVNVLHLADDPQFSEDLQALEAQLAARAAGAVLDFAAVNFINSSNLAGLLKVRKKIISESHRLILCGVSTKVWSAFLVTGLDKLFEFADNVPTALATIQMK